MKYSPLFEEFDVFMQPYRSLLPAVQSGIVPPVDMYQTQTSLVIETPLAGVDPERVEVSVDRGVLTIKGSMERKTEVDEKNYYRKEVRSGSVFRQIPLPIDVQEGKAKAGLDNGMLKIELPKRASEEKQTIKIQVKNKK
ncbi:Hsp20/alpha crystallin family protein [Candidatus Uhrbacteria bacterium UHB]|jgi:HSP20 family protein|nr:Hsp20/alpha crystallin family protein [Candidatus Uhrbacteria bacterium UHB]RIL00333.1 MAG: molecular chaperone [Candidatus Uhrbacteria bacterium]